MQAIQVSIRQALHRAIWMILLPSMAAFLIPLSIVLFLERTNVLPDQSADGSPWYGWGLLISFIGAWLVWSIQVPKWRLWSYERVENLQELKARAVAAQFIWADTSIFTRTEIASRETWRRIRLLEAAKAVPAPPNKSLERTREG